MAEKVDVQPSIWVALNNVKSAIGAVAKKERNTIQNFNFRGVDAVVNAAAPELNKHGVIVTPEVLEHSYEVAEFGSKRTLMGHVQVKVKYTFWGPLGDCVSATVFAESTDSGDKAAAKAMSVAYRIVLLQTLNLPTDEPDPDSESFERSPVKPREPAVTSVEPDWGKIITDVKSVTALRKVWKDAGSAGTLQDKITVDGESLTVQDYLIRRSDQLNLSKSDN